MSDNEPLFMEANFIKCIVSTLEINSLSVDNNTTNVKNQIHKIRNLLLASPTYTLQNHVPILDEIPICTCKKSNSYILTASSLFKMSPIKCGNCFDQIPLYKMIGLSQECKESIFDWQKSYECCDHLQMDGCVGKEWASEQMADHKSELSVIGINLCNELFTVTGIPTFYYLFTYKQIGYENELFKTCPSCNGDWRLNDPSLLLYHFRCNNCKLISDFASSGYEIID